VVAAPLGGIFAIIPAGNLEIRGSSLIVRNVCERQLLSECCEARILNVSRNLEHFDANEFR
jgi:hypothetical protein